MLSVSVISGGNVRVKPMGDPWATAGADIANLGDFTLAGIFAVSDGNGYAESEASCTPLLLLRLGHAFPPKWRPRSGKSNNQDAPRQRLRSIPPLSRLVALSGETARPPS